MSEESKELRLLVEFLHEHDTHRIVARPVEWDEAAEQPRGIDDYGAHQLWRELSISFYVSKAGEDIGGTPTYGWNVDYRPYSVDLRDAKRILSGLAKVQRGLDRLSNDFGYPQTPEDWFARVAAVLGVKRFGYVKSENPKGIWRNTEWRWTDVSGIRSWITRQISEFREPKEVSAEAR